MGEKNKGKGSGRAKRSGVTGREALPGAMAGTGLSGCSGPPRGRSLQGVKSKCAVACSAVASRGLAAGARGQGVAAGHED